MGRFDPGKSVLLVIDVQDAFVEIEASGVPRNNKGAEDHIAALLTSFRQAGLPVIHIRHASLEPESRFRAERPGFRVQGFAKELAGEPVLVKHVNSSFIGTDLEARLRDAGLTDLVVTGATTNHCVETTTRMAGNLGFNAFLVRDATWTFDRMGPDGDVHRAADIQRMTLANLAGEFAEIVTTGDILAAVSTAAAHQKAG